MTPGQYEEQRPEFLRLQKYIEAALLFSGDTFTKEDVWDLIVADKAQFWSGIESAIVTEVVVTPRSKTLHFWLAGGDLRELEAMYPLIEEWGAEIGCTRATLTGRKGWERTFLSKLGWTYAHTTFAKELTNVQGIEADDDG